ncbi:MAG TPA: PHB depolymerase family esterase [Thermoanaerobaculia bacterium]|nr:PHB depolymerase family esterase [Thermoanaerobaculia bacterium]
MLPAIALVLAALAPGSHTIPLGGRSYIAHMPDARGPLPVVINFHGGGGNAARQERFSGMDAVADREHFIVVYPNGTGRAGILVWNAGTCCGRAPLQGIDDVGFTRAVIDDLAKRTSIDRTRIYATGMSNGAMMAYRIAAEASDLVAAIAPVSGSMTLVDFHPTLPVPIMHFHSVDDPRALYNGGLGPPFPLTGTRVLHPPVERQLAKWIAHNGCPATPKVERRLTNATTSATKLVYAPCSSGATVVLWKMTGSGHVWPGKPARSERLLGKPNLLIDANEEIWAFFRNFRRPAADAAGS